MSTKLGCIIRDWAAKCLQVDQNTELIEEILSQPEFAYVTVWAEDNGTIVVDRWDYSFGNGNEEATDPVDWGYVTHFPYEIVSMTVGMRLTNTAATEVGVTVNGANIPVSCVVAGSTTKAVNNAVSYSGPAGDSLNFRTLQNGGGNDVVPSIIIKYSLP